jgi:fumarate hydratase class II
VTFSGSFGNFELNVMMPVMAHNLLQSIELLAAGSQVFARRCVSGLEADREKCKANLELSLSNCTILAPVIGYDKAARIAKVAYETNRTIREVAVEISGLDKSKLDELLDPGKQT